MKFLLKKCLRKKAPEMKPGAILDAVISQSSATACKCLLYKLADYKRGKYSPPQPPLKGKGVAVPELQPSLQVATLSMPSIREV